MKKLIKKGNLGLSFSSNPLAISYGYSTELKPNYYNSFNYNLGILNNTSTPNYSEELGDWYQREIQPTNNQIKLGVGLAASGDKSSVVSAMGKQMAEEVIGDTSKKVSSIFPTSLSKGSDLTNFFGKIGGWSTIGSAADALGSFMPEKTEYSGAKGDITSTLDSAYDSISNTLMAIPGWGTIAGGIMKAGAFLGKGVNALGGGTDGMCVCAGTKVFTANGDIINIEDLKPEDGIIGWNENTKEIRPLIVSHIIEPRLKECVLITLKSGYILRCSIDHPILSDTSSRAKMKIVNGKRIGVRDWKFRRADELKVGDFVGLANNIDYWGNEEIPNSYLVGLLIGDGTYTKGNSCRLVSADSDTWKYIEDNNLGVINHCDDSRLDKYSKEIRTYRIIKGMDLMRSLGIVYLSGTNKTLPKSIGKYTKSSICKLLAGLFDTDGSFSVNEQKDQYSITLYLSNISLLNEVKQLLHKLGIFSTINTRKAAKYLTGGRIINSNESYRLEVCDISSAKKFYELIPINIGHKKETLYRVYLMLSSKSPKEHNDISGAKQLKIIAIENIGLLTVYNLQADNDHTYLANGIITHNTTADAILGSSFLLLSPLGMINGFGGKKADTITKNEQAFETVGSSYGGTSSTVDDALTKSGKKYGLFSNRARKNANSEIAEAKRQQNIMSDIADTATDRFNIQQSTAAINENRRAFALQGGYLLANVRVGKSGMSLELMLQVKLILKSPKKQTSYEVTEKTPINLFNNTLLFKNGGNINKFTEIIPIEETNIEFFQKGGKTNKKSRTLEELIKYAKKENPRFIQRMSEPVRDIEFIDNEGNKARGTHYMTWSTDDNGNAIVYAEIMEDDDGNLKHYGKDAYRRAIDKNDFLIMTPEEAELFTISDEDENGNLFGYKKGWSDFFKSKEFLRGGNVSSKIKDYYKGLDLSDIKIVQDNNARTEGNTIYSPNDEFTVHELWHYLSQNKPNESLREFYENLDDSRISELGGNLEFIKRTGDPGDFYSPSELEARLKAAKFMSQGLNYTKDFFKELRKNENKYGDNMRDLLYMYNDDNLEKLFNISSNYKFKEGGSINVIPEGALHARKHHMDMDGITKKGIPVVDNNGEQQAEIERSEVILRLEVTKELERLYKIYYNESSSLKEKEKAALEAGLMLTNELLNNTVDNTLELL